MPTTFSMMDVSRKSGANALNTQEKAARDLDLSGTPGRPSFLEGLTSGLSRGFLAIFVTLLVLGLALHHNHRAVAQLLEQMASVDQPTSAAAYQMEIALLDAGLAVMNYVTTGDPRHRAQVTKQQDEFERFKLQYDGLIETQLERQIGQRMNVLHERCTKVGDALMDARDEKAQLVAEVAEDFSRMHEILGTFQENAGLSRALTKVAAGLGNFLATSREIHRESALNDLEEARRCLALVLQADRQERQSAVELQEIFEQTAARIGKILALHATLRKNEIELLRLRGQLNELFSGHVHVLTRRDLATTRAEAKNKVQHLQRASLNLLGVFALVCALAAGMILHRSVRLNQEMKLRQASESARARLFEQLVSAQEEERGRLARELHDQLGQELSALLLSLRELEQHPGDGALRTAGPTLQRLQQGARHLLEELHTIAWELRPAALDDLGLHGALSSYVEDWTRRTGVPVDFQSDPAMRDQRLPGPVETTLYRVAQEALTNAMKHARAQAVSLVLQRRGPEVVMVVEDDGAGFVPEQAAPRRTADGQPYRGGLGLLGMKERVNLAGGVLELESAPGAGTTVMVRIPVGSATEPIHEDTAHYPG